MGGAAMARTLSLFSRRNLVFGLVGTAAIGTVAATQRVTGSDLFARLLRPVGLGRRGAPLASANYDDWALQVGSLFTAHTGQVLKLADVQRFPERGKRPAGLRDRAFVARFDVTRGGPLSDSGIVRFNHPEGGALDLLLSAGDPARPLRMLAVLN
jgi:hypothetical protein